MKRNKTFRPNKALEGLLEQLNSLLAPAEQEVFQRYAFPRFPVVFIVGCARAGSTLMLQLCARSRCFAYPSNFLSRFYGAPYIGALIQQMLTCSDYRFRDEFADVSSSLDFASNLGKTKGLLSPNEFWFFWRRFFPCDGFDYPDAPSLHSSAMQEFVSEIAAIESVFNKPLVLKAQIMNCHIPTLSHAFPHALFIHCTREPLYTAQSLLEARLSYYGTPNGWYSFKPPEYERLKNVDPYRQVAGQVYCTERTVRQGLAQLPEERRLEVGYEDFCRAPHKTFLAIKRKFARQGCRVAWRYEGPETFENRNQRRLSAARFKALQRACEQIQEGGLSL